jgi:hypothetical protein
MAVVVGHVSNGELQRIQEAGYDLTDLEAIQDLLRGSEGDDVAVAVWVDCDLVALLVPALCPHCHAAMRSVRSDHDQDGGGFVALRCPRCGAGQDVTYHPPEAE